MNTKKMAGRATLTRPNINLSDGGTLLVFVPRCKFLATAMPQAQGNGEDAKPYARTN